MPEEMLMRPQSKNASAGFSLVEILVGMVMGLLGMIIIFQVFEVSESVKRTSTAGGDAMQYGALALYSIERDIRTAGAGINSPLLAGCTTHMYDAKATPKVRPAITLVPFVIDVDPVDKTLPDMLTMTYGNSQSQGYAVEMTNVMGLPTDALKVKHRYGFLPTNLVVIAQKGKPCWYAEITGLPTTPTETDLLLHGTSAYADINGNMVEPRYNGPSGFTDEDGNVTLYEGGKSYEESPKIYNVSSTPSRNVYSVDMATAQLMLDSNRNDGMAAVADNIVQLKAQYGHDNGVNDGTVTNTTYVALDGMVDNYSSTMPTGATSTDWLSIRAVRIAIVARSALPEKPNDSGVCETTTVEPTWAGGTLTLSHDPDWKCYRYRVFESVVPMRNAIWQQDKLNP
jgi:type IV pilus assembly protein PilW